MKTYKIKSLIYLCCFLAAGVFYYNYEQQQEFQNQFSSSQISELETEDDLEDDEELKNQLQE